MACGFLYLVVIIDWASRAVLAWRLSNTNDASFCAAALEEALLRFGTPRIFNTDQGSTFTAEAFAGKLAATGVAISMDGRGRFMDNIFIERLWRSIKYEEVHLKAYADAREAQAGIGSWMTFYNFQPAPGDEQPGADGGVARRHGQNRGGGKGCGYAASLGQRKRVAHIPTAEAARSGLILEGQRQARSHLKSNVPWSHEWGPVQPGPAPKIMVEVTITNLSPEQEARFGANVEWLNTVSGTFYQEAKPAGVDAAEIKAALRVTFIGEYDPDEDDFVGNTYFARSLSEEDTPTPFSKKDKQHCGFLFLRSLRTGSRALSLEHGSLLDIILRLKEIRPRMWEGTIGTLASFDVASDPELGISGVLESVDKPLKKYVPREWGVKPHLKGVEPDP